MAAFAQPGRVLVEFSAFGELSIDAGGPAVGKRLLPARHGIKAYISISLQDLSCLGRSYGYSRHLIAIIHVAIAIGSATLLLQAPRAEEQKAHCDQNDPSHGWV